MLAAEGAVSVKWEVLPGFSEEQLSMIASALAVGDRVCCKGGGANRQTICVTRRQASALEDWAYENLGCDKRLDTDDAYLDRFLQSA